jgi:5-hydroxyisourate hydrolase-like protein (transthyretin family)
MEFMTRFLPVTLSVCVLASVAFAEQKSNGKPETPTAVLNLTVLKDSNGKPVKNAEIVLHPVDEHGRQKQESLELKTHDDGKADASGIAYGKVRIQVIAHGYRTFGADYVVNQPTLDITIKLEKPAEQYSIYK